MSSLDPRDTMKHEESLPEPLFTLDSASDTRDDVFAIPLIIEDEFPHHLVDTSYVSSVEGADDASSSAPAKKQRKQALHVLDPKTRKYICPFGGCAREFSTSGHLARHHRIHTGEKNHACALCGVRFSRQDNCNQHLKSHFRPPRLGRRTASAASTEELHEEPSARPSGPVHATSYAGSLVTVSEADADSIHGATVLSDVASINGAVVSDISSLHETSHDLPHDNFSPSLTSRHVSEFLPATVLPDSFYYLGGGFEEGTPSLGYDSSATEESNAFSAFNVSDFISQEDFFQWSAGVIVPDTEAETESIEAAFVTEDI